MKLQITQFHLEAALRDAVMTGRVQQLTMSETIARNIIHSLLGANALKVIRED